jgi:hypothetical protein
MDRCCPKQDPDLELGFIPMEQVSRLASVLCTD